MYMVFLDKNGKIIQQIKHLNREKDEEANAIIQTLDGGYVLAGYSNSPNPTTDSQNGGKDAWIVKTDSKGNAIWDKNIGTPKDDIFYGITEDNKGNLYIVGSSNDKPFLVKTDAWGKEITKIILNDNTPNITGSINAIIYHDDHITMTGFEVDKSTLKKSVLIAQYDTNCAVIWAKKYPQGEGKDIIITSDGDFAIAGVTQNRGSNYADDMLWMKIDKNGSLKAQKEYGGGGKDGANALTQCPNGDFLLAGYTYSHRRGAARSNLCLYRINKNGESVWKSNQHFGGEFSDEAKDVLFTTDGAYLIAGFTCPKITDASDMWVLQTKKDTTFLPSQSSNFTLIAQKFRVKQSDDTLRAEERGWYAFAVKNNTSQEIRNVVATVRCLQPITGLEYTEKLQLGHITANSTQVFGIPIFSANKELMDGKADFEVIVNADNAPSQTFQFNIHTKRFAAPKIIVQQYAFVNAKGEYTLRRGDNETIKLKITLQNTGSIAANEVVVRFGRPKKIYATNAKDTLQRIVSLAAGEKREVSFTIGAEKGYWIDTIPISVSIAYKELSQQHVTICTTQFAPPIAPPPVVTTVDYINLTWLTPNEDVVGNVITTNTQTFTIKINAKSNKLLHRDSFEVLTSPIQQGAKFDKVSLKTFSSDGASAVQSINFSYDIPLQEGDNEIKVRVRNGNLQQETATLKVKYVLDKPVLHILSVGVKHVDLKFSMKDATDFANVFQTQKGSLFKNVKIRVLNDSSNTGKIAILRAFRDIVNDFISNEPSSIQTNDVLFIFISSHGKKPEELDKQIKYYIPCYKYDMVYPEDTAIDFKQEVIDRLKSVACKKVIFLDACFSGYVAHFKSIIPADFTIITSSYETEKSWENDKWQNGAFTAAILNTIHQAKGVLTLNNLFESVQQSVPKMVENTVKGESQHPTIIINNDTVKDLPLLKSDK